MPSKLAQIGGFLHDIVDGFIGDDCPTQAAALAYYTVFALAPLMVLVMVVASVFLPEEVIGAAIHGQSNALIGPDAAEQLRLMVVEVRARPGESVVARVLGTLLLVYGATGVVGQLQTALDGVGARAASLATGPARPPKPRRGFFARRLLSMALILGIAFILLVSLVLSATVSAVSARAVALVPDAWSGAGLLVLDGGLSVAVAGGLFTAMYKLLPVARVAWRDAALGGLVTAILFSAGKALIGLYLGNSSIGTAYGAASSLAILLVWVYYSSVIVLLGAEFTNVVAERRTAT